MSAIKTVRVGVMPGRINEFAVEEGSSIAQVLEIAGLTTTGYEVKVDGESVTNLDDTTVTSSTNLVLLAKQVKGNAALRIGVMPGRINEFAVEPGTTLRQALEIAELSTTGYEVKVDGESVTDLDQDVSGANLILLAKQVKGN